MISFTISSILQVVCASRQANDHLRIDLLLSRPNNDPSIIRIQRWFLVNHYLKLEEER